MAEGNTQQKDLGVYIHASMKQKTTNLTKGESLCELWLWPYIVLVDDAGRRNPRKHQSWEISFHLLKLDMTLHTRLEIQDSWTKSQANWPSMSRYIIYIHMRKCRLLMSSYRYFQNKIKCRHIDINIVVDCLSQSV